MFRKVLIAFSLVLLSVPLTPAEKSRQGDISHLFALIDQADQMVVYSEGFRREFVVYRSSKRKDFEELKFAITLKRSGGPFVCACVDGPEIALLKNNEEIASVWNHEGTAIGSSVWDGDWENNDPNRWLSWFDARGMKDARAFYVQRQAQSTKAAADERRWRRAMPASIRALWPDTLKHYQPPTESPDLGVLNAALGKQYSDTDERIRALMAWFGSGAGPWSGFPGYEEIAEKLLRQYPTAELVKAVENRDLSEQELEGAARIFGGWTPDPNRAVIPEPLKSVLLEHCLKSPDQDKVERAKTAFAP